ncbi:MAG TPA: hypothetical protein VN633_21385, partial [Bryobacteraceae bacterium]|nr:hypothetical protein [Bryobacteraceae bacterium]
NVISITDGQIYLEGDLFNANIRPAINVGISVSRVGGSAQIKAMRAVAGSLRLDLAQYRSLAAFAQFGSDLDKASQAQLNRGQRLTELLKQNQFSPMPVEKQVVSIYTGVNGHLDDVPVTDVRRFEADFLSLMENAHSSVLQTIREKKELPNELKQQLDGIIKEFKQRFMADKDARKKETAKA